MPYKNFQIIHGNRWKLSKVLRGSIVDFFQVLRLEKRVSALMNGNYRLVIINICYGIEKNIISFLVKVM